MKGPHAELETLLAYWLGELGEAEEAALEEHYLGCGLCSGRLADVEALGSGVRRAFASGRLYYVATPVFIEQLRSGGLRVREYVVPRNGSVNCSVGPDDEVLIGRMEAPLEGVQRVDALLAGHRCEDVPFDAASNHVVFVPSLAHLRSLPAHVQVVRLVAVQADGERVLGEYTFNHSGPQ